MGCVFYLAFVRFGVMWRHFRHRHCLLSVIRSFFLWVREQLCFRMGVHGGFADMGSGTRVRWFHSDLASTRTCTCTATQEVYSHVHTHSHLHSRYTFAHTLMRTLILTFTHTRTCTYTLSLILAFTVTLRLIYTHICIHI